MAFATRQRAPLSPPAAELSPIVAQDRRLRPYRLPVPATEPPLDPGYPDPGYSDPGYPDPGSQEPGYRDPYATPRSARPPSGSLWTLDLDFPAGVPRPDTRALRLVTEREASGRPEAAPPDGHPGPDDPVGLARFMARRPTPAKALPEPRQWTLRLLQGVLEVMAGRRPPQQLIRWCDEAVYSDVVARSRDPRTQAGGRPQVRSLRVCCPRDGVVEAAAVFSVAGRCRAIAVRLEGLDGRWRATALEML